ncbi:MAG: phosphoribosyltransferase family protein [Pseudomonadota bacterium]|nr:phosphoribosyltransferase family protein [Pseudomonadota bacterium]
MPRFHDRNDAGRQLADLLAPEVTRTAVVLALPRGGVAVAVPICERLNLPLDLALPRKIGHPGNPEFAVAAVGEQGAVVPDPAALAHLDPGWLGEAEAAARTEARRRRDRYLGGAAPSTLRGHEALLVDDGVATGLTMRAAIKDVQAREAERIVIAVPIIADDTAQALEAEVDRVIAVWRPTSFLGAVGAYYEQFPQLTDSEVLRLLNAVRRHPSPVAP